MYKVDAAEESNKGCQPVSSSFYRHNFVTDYNLAFHRPKKKDQRLLCAQLCTWWRNKLVVSRHEGEVLRALKEKKRIKSWKRRRQKNRKQKEKERKEEWAEADGSLHEAVFWHAVCSPDTMFCRCISHYKRKLAVYNLSVFSLANEQGVCYPWNETLGQKGLCEVATCLMIYLSY